MEVKLDVFSSISGSRIEPLHANKYVHYYIYYNDDSIESIE